MRPQPHPWCAAYIALKRSCIGFCYRILAKARITGGYFLQTQFIFPVGGLAEVDIYHIQFKFDRETPYAVKEGSILV
jgi:hypothetical protein